MASDTMYESGKLESYGKRPGRMRLVPASATPFLLFKEDKMSRKIASTFVALSFVFVGVSAAIAEDPPPPVKAPSPVQQAVKGISLVGKCPQGWHVQPGSVAYEGKMFACVPNKPKEKIKCAPKFEYWEKECSFGCTPIIY